jgi:hypothetical protein
MRKPRGILARAFAAAMVIWLGLVITEPLPLDACPMHGIHSMHGVAAAGHAAHSMSHSAHHGTEKTASHQCTCIGDCSAGVGSALAPAAVGSIGARIIREASEAARGATRALGEAAEHLLPFANGPPVIS